MLGAIGVLGRGIVSRGFIGTINPKNRRTGGDREDIDALRAGPAAATAGDSAEGWRRSRQIDTQQRTVFTGAEGRVTDTNVKVKN
jgi:hypothetical protein